MAGPDRRSQQEARSSSSTKRFCGNNRTAIDEWAKEGETVFSIGGKARGLPQATLPAFRSGRRGGAYVWGRGGRVFVVTNLMTAAGSFREGL